MLITASGVNLAAKGFIVENGVGNAEIIVSDKPSRSAKLAGSELQKYIKKISGAKLPVLTAPSGKAKVLIYVGKSKFTDKLGVTTKGLKAGGFRIKSIGNALVLLGDDKDFVPRGPMNMSGNNQAAKDEAMAKWDKLTNNAGWGNPKAKGMYRFYNKDLDIWNFDEIGTFNAVSEFLRKLGVRWYMPGDLGEIVPEKKTIALTKIDETVNPDFEMRRFFGPYRVESDIYVLWCLRMGLNWGLNSDTSAHGIAQLTGRKEFKEKHPDVYALYNGKRASKLNQVCLSSEELFKENVAYVRKIFDIYDCDSVSVMPADAFVAICKCEKCRGKDTPERGYYGILSDYVWDYVNRIAKEVEKTHPHKFIHCLAYGSYLEPPLKIKKLNKNILVGIVGARRPRDPLPEQQKEIKKRREAWMKLTPNKIYNFENYPFLGRGEHRPLYAPHLIAKTLNDTKGISFGEDIWFSHCKSSPVYNGGRGMYAPGFFHLYLYTTARFYWGGKDKDVDAMLNEYYRLFYGPAAGEMKAFIEYSEKNWTYMNDDKEKISQAFKLLEKARTKVKADSVYGKRIQLVCDYMKPLEARLKQLAIGRGKVPKVRAFRVVKDSDIKIDGKFDDAFWQRFRHDNGILRNVENGSKAKFRTGFRVAVSPNNIYFAIRCEEMKGRKFNSTTKDKDDAAIWYGDCIELLIETDSNSYYQIAFNPDGALVDLERKGTNRDFRWDSKAEMAMEKGDGFWNIEIRIPYVANNDDPYHMLTGRKPSPELPWYFNVCRQRIDGKKPDLTALAPTGKRAFHVPLKFAMLYEGRTLKEREALRKRLAERAAQKNKKNK